MPITQDEWDNGIVNTTQQLRSVVTKILYSTEEGYQIGELLDVIIKPNNDLPDAVQAEIKTLNDDERWSGIVAVADQKSTLDTMLNELCKNGTIESKDITQSTGKTAKYYRGKSDQRHP